MTGTLYIGKYLFAIVGDKCASQGARFISGKQEPWPIERLIQQDGFVITDPVLLC